MTKRAVHFGIDDYCHDDYCGDLRDLTGGVADAELLHELSYDAGFEKVGAGIYRDSEVDEARVFASIDAVKDLGRGDIFLLTFAGYGIAPQYGYGWALYEEDLPFRRLFAKLRATISDDVVVILISASCYSGRVAEQTSATVRELSAAAVVRRLRVALETFRDKAEPRTVATIDRRVDVRGPLVVHLAACGEYQVIPDANPSGFVAAIDRVGRDGTERTFEAFRDAIDDLRPESEEPQLDARTPPNIPWPLWVPRLEVAQRIVKRAEALRRSGDMNPR
jgi:hypothetical protein